MREPIFNKIPAIMFVTYTAVMLALGWFITFGLDTWGNKFVGGSLAVIITVAWLLDRSDREGLRKSAD